MIDKEARKQAAELDGCYAIKTDLPAKAVMAETLPQRYKDLAQVERAFCTFKTGPPELRPAFVRKEEGTKGHAFVVMLACLPERELDRYWQGLEITTAEGIDELGSLRGVEITMGHDPIRM